MKLRCKPSPCAGFTLIEILVVIIVIAILMAGSFKMMSLANESAKIAKTKAILERVHNALGAFYAEYGCYPPSGQYERVDNEGRMVYQKGLMPVTYIMPLSVDNEHEAASAGFSALSPQDSEEKDMVFGLVSYLVPRLSSMYGANAEGNGLPDKDRLLFYKRAKQIDNWTGSASWDQALNAEVADPRTDVCNRWKPHIADILDPAWDNEAYMVIYVQGKDMRRMRTIRDAWNNDLMYQCLPPLQSYRLVSCGPDGVQGNEKADADNIEVTNR